ncbi:hypothetical protein [Paludisphaera mucosa]|uniref:Uncharacterized protein n=1 Tax=Paludisphaera mucosa TaxID=3030827 RepID=A0ABT6FIF3_9BACT|nr:hypothetical protein [Paludisphaera mucosa]MDG3007347.1 hypothetical protein [Paludisphaera mucosa]
MSEGEAPDAEMLSARIVDDALKLIGDGHVTSIQLLEAERRWASMGAIPETCKTLRLMVSALTSPPQGSRRIDNAREVIEEGLLLSMSYFGEGSALATSHATMEGPASYKPPVVIIIHGIQTIAPWMKDLSRELKDAGFRPRTMDYDVFIFVWLLLPFLRRRKVEHFKRLYDEICEDTGDTRPSIVAHSFGTYLVAKAMRVHNLRFNRIILCGCIVETDYPWKTCFDEGLANAALNDHGSQDFWAWVATYVVKDAGQAGIYGFGEQDGRLAQICHAHFRHSDYFSTPTYRDTWVPFLRGQPHRQAINLPDAGPNRRFFWTMVTLGIAIAAFFVYRWLRG